jgi:hypothetical protein
MARFRRRLLAAAAATAAVVALGVVARTHSWDGRDDRAAVAVVADGAVAVGAGARQAESAPATNPRPKAANAADDVNVDLPGLLRKLCPKLGTATGAQRCLSLLTAVFNSPQCVARLLAATVVTMSSLLFALGSIACLSILGPALVRLAALYNCVKAHRDLGYCLSRPAVRARPLDG